jgi:Spy/CpxP family protein refolding chaperone
MKTMTAIAAFLIVSLPLVTATARQHHPGQGPGGPMDPEFMIEGPRQDPHNRRDRMCFGDPDIMKKKFGLSDEQIDAIEEINQKYREHLLDIRDKLQPKHSRLRKMLLKEKIDLNDVNSLLREIAELEVELRMARIRQRIEIDNLLTPEQRKKIRREARRGGMGNE